MLMLRRMASLRFPSGKQTILGLGATKLGRADVARYPEAITVSREQVLAELCCLDGRAALRLTSCGSSNPTVVVRAASRDRPLELQQGESAVLHNGDAFSLICTRPDLAIQVHIPPAAQRPPATREGTAAGYMPAGREGGAAVAAPPGSAPSTSHNSSPERAVAPTTQPSQQSSRHTEASGSYVTGDGDLDGLSDEGADSGRSGGAGPGPGSLTSPVSTGKGQRGKRRGPGAGGKDTARGVGNNKPPVQGLPPVLLLLAGLPGSGKSTFSRSLQDASTVSWVHVNQDAINKGKPGKREQCVAALRAALAEGSCCIIDRCHLDASQRATFLELATECHVAAHCVALAIPAQACAGRVAARTDHPGGVQGDNNRAVVFRMAKQQDAKGWPPTAAEGFTSVMDCCTDSDANAAVRAWAAYGAAAAAGGGGAAAALTTATAVGRSSESAKPIGAAQGTAEAQAAPTLAMWQAYVAKRKPPAAATAITAFFKPAAAKAAAGATGTGAVPGVKAMAAGKAPAASAATEAGPQQAPAAGGSQVGAARSALMAGARSEPGSAVTGARPRGAESPPAAEQRPAKRPATAQLSVGVAPHGGGTGAPEGKGAGSPGSGHAAKPNAAPGSQQSQGNGGGGSASGTGAASPSPGGGANAFAVLMKGSRQAAAAAAGAKPNPTGVARATLGGADVDKRFKLDSPWAQALRKAAQDPEGSQQQVLHKDEEVVVIMDAFPKARSHALVIARDPALRSIADLRAEHLPLLKHMRQVALDWISKRKEQVPGTAAFKLGFHAVPSMCQLHLHVISQDFDSPALKNKKHWNTFTTEFFRPLDLVLRELEGHGKLTLISEAEAKRFEGQELRCHACGLAQKSIPALKSHIVACDAVKCLPGL